MRGIRFVGDALAPSGYGNALRDLAKQFHELGIPFYFDHIEHDKNRADLCEFWDKHMDKYRQEIPYDIIVNVTTPEFYKFKPDKKVVAWTFWETTKFPRIEIGGGREGDWVKQMNKLDEFWAPTTFVKDVAIGCGVETPIQLLPWPCVSKYINIERPRLDSASINKAIKDKFVIGSIGQFTERKNFRDFIMALCSTFNKEEDVIGLIKTYRSNDSSRETNVVRTVLSEWKKSLNIPDACSFCGVHSILSESQMVALLDTIDLYVCTSRGEGMSGPLIHAMAMGKPVISSDFSAMSDFIYGDTSLKVVRYCLEPVHSMSHIPWYGHRQDWARLNVSDIREGMREGYELWRDDRDRFEEIGQRGRDFVRKIYSDEAVQKRIKELI